MIESPIFDNPWERKDREKKHRPINQLYKLQAYRTRTLESEFCMGGQIRIDSLPYKIFTPVFSCTKKNSYIGILAMEFGGHLPSGKERERFGGRA